MTKPKPSSSVLAKLLSLLSSALVSVLLPIGTTLAHGARQSMLGNMPVASARPGAFQQDSNDGDVYRSREHEFEIKFPNGWDVSKGGEGVAVVALDHKGSSINVSVGPYNGHDPTEKELQLMVNAGAAATKRDFPGAVIIAKGLRDLSGKKGPYQKFRVVYSAQGYSVTNITVNYTVFMNRRVYTITASAPLNSYVEIEPLLSASVSSFVVRGDRRRIRQ